MRHRPPFRRFALAVTAALALSAGTGSADEPPPDLLAIMQALNADTQRLAGALFIEDWAAAGEAAGAIADHPMAPLAERMKILTHLGTRAGQFRAHDQAVHDAATAIADAVNRRDLAEAGAQYGVLVQGCLSCHGAFRQELRALRLNADETSAAAGE